MDTIGEITFVLSKQVSFIQRFLNYDIFNLSHKRNKQYIADAGQLTDTFNTRVLLNVLLEYINLLQF